MRVSVMFATGIAATLATAPAEAQVAGSRLFAIKCAICHSDPGTAMDLPKIGPSLKHVVGRTAGTSPTYKMYSPAMKAFGKTWTTKQLDAYLASPRTIVPGTRMAFAGLSAPTDRAAIIAYVNNPNAK